MRRGIIKAVVFFAVFVIAQMISDRVINKDHDNLTVEISSASLPLITMRTDDETYNLLRGNSLPMEVVHERGAVTLLSEGRRALFSVKLYGREVEMVSYELRDLSGERLIETGDITEFQRSTDTMSGGIALKDLIDHNVEYSLMIKLVLDDGKPYYYYTRIIWGENLHLDDKIYFVRDFHQKQFDKEAASELTRYLETNSRLEKNYSFHKVNIHSSLNQITFGNLNVREVVAPTYSLMEIGSQTASIVVDSVVADTGKEAPDYYQIQEYYRVKYGSDRMYLLDYQRTMTQIPEIEKLYANDKILLGITDTNVPMAESLDGSILVFEQAGHLIEYDAENNRFIELYGPDDILDLRMLYNAPDVRILKITDADVVFAICGYQNRGTHEGETGLVVYRYSGKRNTLEELVYLPSAKESSLLEKNLEMLSFLNDHDQLYLAFEHAVYRIHLESGEVEQFIAGREYESLCVSPDHSVLVWTTERAGGQGNSLHIRDLNLDQDYVIASKTGEIMMAYGFMNQDLIYGAVRNEDITRQKNGTMLYPMYKVCICDSQGQLLKEYAKDGIYITGVSVQDNQITLLRATRSDSEFLAAYEDHITNNVEKTSGKNEVVYADIDIYERYVQIKVKKAIDTKTVVKVVPKEVVSEGEKENPISGEEDSKLFYTYGPYGAELSTLQPSQAILKAEEISGVVIDSKGRYVWRKEKQHARNQIMAIKERGCEEGESSLYVCLDTILGYRGIVKNIKGDLEAQKTAVSILEESLDQDRILDLEGASLSSVLYYLDQDIPVLALLSDGEAVLLTGYNEQNVVIFNPSKKTLAKKGMNDSKQWFEENGNHFITYLPDQK